MSEEKNYRFETLQLHAGYRPDPATGARQVPIYATSSYQFRDSGHAARLFALQEFGNIYSRIMNPTNDALEKRIAALEGGVGALATSSGHAAQFLALTTLAGTSDNIVSTPNLYGGSVNQFRVTLPHFGIEARFTGRSEDPEDFLRLTDARTRAWFIESIGNPALNIPDFEAVFAAARKAGVAVVVDNTFGIGGYLFRPFDWGAALVTHSATKWLGGHGSAIAGLIVDSGRFPWDNGRYPLLTEPQPGYHGLKLIETFGNLAFIVKARVDGLRDQGQSLGPSEAFQILIGIETLSLRAERHVENTLAIARWLRDQEEVAWVNYPGLEDHPSYARAQKYFRGKPGAVLTFGLKGGHEAAKAFIDRLELVSHLANVGDARTLAIHPASTTHSQLSAEQQALAGVTPELVRLSIGLEHVEDIKDDVRQALKSAHRVLQSVASA
ncbi:MAG: O-acetylhomoserine aminocarboxypropyltransferase/cysteine synthase [Betaproteobacteria bacterium]|nr:O-acetylhomoserine aminocarboxypropyltransferase/cysteine synthase [Betaproteobacteria bacterium]